MEFHKIETLFERDKKTLKVFSDKLNNPVYGILKTWQFTEKIKGTNIRCIWHPPDPHGGIPSLSFGGKTDNAQIYTDLVKWLYENITIEKMGLVFPDTDAIVYGEGCGAGIEKGGGYSKTKQMIVFDVLVAGKWWLNWENTCDVAKKLGLKTVPFIGNMTLEKGVEMVKKGFDSILAKENTGEIMPAEGIVGRTVETLFDKKGSRIIIKLKTKDFLQEDSCENG